MSIPPAGRPPGRFRRWYIAHAGGILLLLGGLQAALVATDSIELAVTGDVGYNGENIFVIVLESITAACFLGVGIALAVWRRRARATAADGAAATEAAAASRTKAD